MNEESLEFCNIRRVSSQSRKMCRPCGGKLNIPGITEKRRQLHSVMRLSHRKAWPVFWPVFLSLIVSCVRTFTEIVNLKRVFIIIKHEVEKLFKLLLVPAYCG